jgi:hypothetical protein
MDKFVNSPNSRLSGITTEGGNPPPENGRSRSILLREPFPTSFFCETNRRETEAKKQGMYHLALLANIIENL